MSSRVAEVHRTTEETDVLIRLNIDECGSVNVDTGVEVMDVLLNAMAENAG